MRYTPLTEEAKKFILDNCREMTPKVIAENIGRKDCVVYAHLKSRGIKPHKEKKETSYLMEPRERFTGK